MAIQGAQDIAIARLRVRGDKSIAEACARDLQQASWPLQLPANIHNAWVLVRELYVKGNSQQLRHQLRQQSAQQLNSLLAQAVEGRNASNNTLAVQFTSLAELLAFLLRDIAQGQAAGKWYWQRWSYALRISREQAIAQLFCEHLAELPAVVENLAAIGQLKLVWQSISSPTAAILVTQLARYHGITTDGLVNRMDRVDLAVDGQIVQTAERQLQRQVRLLAGWSSVLQHLAEDDHRWRLAALICGISYCPLLIMRNAITFVNVFVRVVQLQLATQKSIAEEIAELTQDIKPAQNAVESSHSVQKTSEVATSIAVVSLQNNHLAEIKVSQALLDVANFPTPESHPAQQQNKYLLLQSIVNKTEVKKGKKSTSTNAIDLLSHQYINAGDSQFITKAGGFFYLINALRPLLTADFFATQALATGWQWLFDCAWLLAARAGFELDLPLLRFIATMTACDNARDAGYVLPSPSLAKEIQNIFSQLEQRWEKEPLWTAANNFLLCPAQITADASHIDVFYSLQSVRLDVRLAGLDVNPGWVPWLGRVVTFHYLDSLNIAAQKPEIPHA